MWYQEKLELRVALRTQAGHRNKRCSPCITAQHHGDTQVWALGSACQTGWDGERGHRNTHQALDFQGKSENASPATERSRPVAQIQGTGRHDSAAKAEAPAEPHPGNVSVNSRQCCPKDVQGIFLPAQK